MVTRQSWKDGDVAVKREGKTAVAGVGSNEERRATERNVAVHGSAAQEGNAAVAGEVSNGKGDDAVRRRERQMDV